MKTTDYRALLHAIVESLPRCWDCSAPATKTTGTPRWCDLHVPEACGDIAHAQPLRAALHALAEPAPEDPRAKLVRVLKETRHAYDVRRVAVERDIIAAWDADDR